MLKKMQFLCNSAWNINASQATELHTAFDEMEQADQIESVRAIARGDQFPKTVLDVFDGNEKAIVEFRSRCDNLLPSILREVSEVSK